MKNDDSMMLYVHIPFCQRKCDYCDFLSMVCDEDTVSRYFSALSKQLISKSEFAENIPVSSVFFGGGTPSCVDPKHIYETMDIIRKHYLLKDDAEISMESNPNSVKEEGLNIYRESGINRISLGLQSTNDSELNLLSRLHSYEDFLRAYDNCRKVGFDNINVDLMSGLPGQSMNSLRESLCRVATLNPEHISVYSLIIEEGTKFYEKYSDGRGLVDEDTDRDMYHETLEILKSFDYERYEISNYSKAGRECRHNLGYWTGRPYLGFGISAASYYDKKRYVVHRNLKDFIAGDFTQEETLLSDRDIIEEFMFLGLRLTKGVSKAEFQRRFSQSIESLYPGLLEKLCSENLIENNDYVRLTEKGMDLANYVMAQFLFD